tara:strand:- start:508 stop:885 length:378 start_codon:yes stop_codon:yes gene_type:complete
MKLTESQLRQLVKEEIDHMVDEGLFSFLGGAAKPASDAMSGAGEKIKKFAKKSWRAGKLASVASDLESVSRLMKKYVDRAVKLAEEIPDEKADARTKVLNQLKGIESGANAATKGAKQLRLQMEE